MSSDKQKQIGDYLLNEEIGSGGFAKVVLGTHIPTGEKVAIKIMDKEQILSDELNKERVLSEIAILKIVRHNNIIKLYEVMETPQKIYLVMEYCDGGELFDYIVSKQHLSEKQACRFFQEIIDALTYLHSQNIVHRDVKPENILLESFGKSMTCKLIDFGISRTYTLDKLITTPCGTASYAPPEMHRGEEYYGLLSDVWSAGVLLYAMVFGYLPFCEEDEDTNIDNIIKGNYEIPEEASPELSDFLTHILDIDPLTRYDLEQIKKHPWYNIVSPVKALPGIIIGYHKIPIDERILNVCEAYGFDKNAVKQSVMENKYDNKSSIYYIILSKMKREGYDSIADLFSDDYIEYIKNPNNLIKKEEKEDIKTEDKEKDNEEEKKKELTVLSDVIKQNDEENNKNKDNTDKKLINPELDQISTENQLKPNKSEAEISVASESSKKDKNKENQDISYNSSPKRNNDNESYVSSPKRNNENESYVSSPKRNNENESYVSTPKKNNDNESNVSSPKRKDSISSKSSPQKEEIKKADSLIETNINNNENKPLETLNQKILEQPNIDKKGENINEIEVNETPKEEIINKQPEIIVEQPKPEEIVNENININPTVEEIVKGEDIIKNEIQKPEPEPETITITPSIEVQIPSLTNIDKDKENKQEKEISNQIEPTKSEEPIITLAEKITPENENEIVNKNENIENIENVNEVKVDNIEAKIEKKPEQIEKKDNKLKPEIAVSNKARDPTVNYPLIPKRSFFIYSNTRKMLSFNIDDDDDKNKLNVSFSKKLSDSLKENVLKLKNPKMKNPNKEKEINKALQEIKQKKGTANTKAKKGGIPKQNNKKNKKISNEPLFKDNKRKDHTIIRNRNASAAHNENRRNNNNEDNNDKNKKKKEISTSMAKIKGKDINNANNIDLKNNIKKIKNDKKGNENSAKKRNISIIKKDSKDDKNKKSNVNIIKKDSKEDKNKKSNIYLKKNIPKPPSTIKKNKNTSSAFALNTTSNVKPIRKNSSAQKKNILKTPSKNLDKTHFEPIYRKLDNTNTNANANNNNENPNPNGILNKTIQLSDVKRSNKKSKIPYDKNSGKKYKKNIRINFKNIEEEDIKEKDANKTTTEINYKKSSSNQISSTFNLSNDNNKGNSTTTNTKKRKINHNKSNSMRRNINDKRIYTQNNDNNKSHANLNNLNRNNSKNEKGIKLPNKNRYQSVIKTERATDKTKKFLDMSAYEGTKTEITSGKNGNVKFLNNNKGIKRSKNNYYGPIDIKNLVIGNSSNEINDKIIDILHKNRVKYWKLNPYKFYCNKNGEIFVIEVFILSNKIIVNEDKNNDKNKDEGEAPELDINSNNAEDNDNKDNNSIINDENKNKNNNKAKKIFYITVLSKDSSNKAQAKNINKIINKKFRELNKKS